MNDKHKMKIEEAANILRKEGWLFGPCGNPDPAHHIMLFLEGFEHGVFIMRRKLYSPRSGWMQDEGWGE